MLRLIIGKAGTGKTAAVINEIADAVKAQRGGNMLIVPEQYSHEAEREMCLVCGDRASLYAEVFSFTGLARRVMSELGGGAAAYLDKGGRQLCMALAVKNVASRLKVYGAARRRAELQDMLLGAVDELKSSGVTSDMLMRAAEGLDDGLGDKLNDLALVCEAYDAVVSNGHADPADRLTVLAQQIADSSFGPETNVYVDGFTDFTYQEREVLRALLEKGVQLTVCLTVDAPDGDSEVYGISRRALRSLYAAAKDAEQDTELVRFDAKSPSQLDIFADRMFSYSSEKSDGDAIELFACDSMASECEFAAAKALELVREKGLRWRDIAVAVRGFDDYRTQLESAFASYNVPLYTARKGEVLSKPLPAMIAGAYEIISGGWELDDVVSYLRTGLTGLTPDECDELENYAYKWQIRGSAWTRDGDWRQHPDGYGEEYTDETNERLRRINALRRIIVRPIQRLAENSAAADTAIGQAQALADYLEDTGLSLRLEERADALRNAGREALAQEYLQLWELIVTALEQAAAILGESESDSESFSKLFTMMLSKYDVGSIPVSLDRVQAGEFDRMRRRNIKYLIVLGASDNRLPRTDEGGGMFSNDERGRLLEMDIDLGGAGDDELWREFSLIYNCLSLPSEGLIMTYPLADTDGAACRPAFVYNRARAMFGLDVQRPDMTALRLTAPAPALGVAAQGIRSGSVREAAAAEYFIRTEPGKIEAAERASKLTRGKLSPEAVTALYGSRLRLSASRIDKFASCRFAYFCEYGLRAKPYEPAGFKPPEIGTFMHAVLENTAREVRARGGFKAVSDEELNAICDKYIEKYVREELNDFSEKSKRFVYLFRRLTRDVHQVVQDMAQELRNSDFVPLDFELNFSDAENMQPVELGEDDAQLRLTGVVDRVDGWLKGDKLYLRVVDYKTGRKKFSLSDVWYGMGLQMLLYLFALEDNGEARYGHEIVPAGVMYVPARNALLSLKEDVSDEDAEAKRLDEIRRSGLVLDDPALLDAWENGGAENGRYIPVKFRYGKPSPETLASAERMGLLSRHIKTTLCGMAQELKSGSIAADPYYRSQQENACLGCDYFDACHFSDGENGEHNRYQPKLAADKVWTILEGGDVNA